MAATAPGVIPQSRPARREYDLVAFVAKLIFGLSILAAVGVVGYQWYLGRSIEAMGAELESRRAEVTNGVTTDLIRLNDRIVSVDALVKNHEVLSPFFSFLAASTPKNVQFTQFGFAHGKEGLEVTMSGAARSYTSLALEASTLEHSTYVRNPVFSEIRLDEKGNVAFVARGLLSQDLVSYGKTVGRTAPPPAASAATSSAPSTGSGQAATTTKSVATTTPKTASTTPNF